MELKFIIPQTYECPLWTFWIKMILYLYKSKKTIASILWFNNNAEIKFRNLDFSTVNIDESNISCCVSRPSWPFQKSLVQDHYTKAIILTLQITAVSDKSISWYDLILIHAAIRNAKTKIKRKVLYILRI